MKTILRALLAIMLLGVLIGQSAFAQTAGAVRTDSVWAVAQASDPVTSWHAEVYAQINPYWTSAFLYEYNFATNEYHICAANSNVVATWSPSGSARIRFTPNNPSDCTLAEVVVTCGKTSATVIGMEEVTMVFSTKAPYVTAGPTHYKRVNMSSLECSFVGVGGQYVTNSGIVSAIQAVTAP